jgi:RNA polymerase sigma-70 factor (ECF subfamily)
MTRTGEQTGLAGVRSSDGAIRENETADFLKRIRRGDADAFEAVAREVSPRLFRLAMRLSGNREEAEDLVQETLVRALPALRRFEGRSRLSTYLVRALTNLWKNRLRSRARSRVVSWFQSGGRENEHDGAGIDPPDPGPSADERIEAEGRAAQVRLAVTRLHPDRRVTLLLREVEELSYEEIASITGVPVGTVRSRLARARDDLRSLLGGKP